MIQLLGLRMVEWDYKEVMEFNVDGIGAQFTKWDFALVKELKFIMHSDENSVDLTVPKVRITKIHTQYMNNFPLSTKTSFVIYLIKDNTIMTQLLSKLPFSIS